MSGSLRLEAYQWRRSAKTVGTHARGAMAWKSMTNVAAMCEEKKTKNATRVNPFNAFIAWLSGRKVRGFDV